MRRLALGFLFLAIIAILTTPETRADLRVTAIDGREVVVKRGPAPAREKGIVANARNVGPNADVTVFAGPDMDAANNDYRRIQNAINAATPGDTITLSGNFDLNSPFAFQAWELGNDGIAATGDDYGVTIPLNLANITLTAASLGSATIQGPTDLANVDLEGFLYFDGAGDNPGWTISNLQILDFDMGIGMFFGAGGADAYNNTVITNNLIRLPNDLNGTVAPADALQNIAIHYSFGTNQTISNNTIQIPGDSLSDVGSNAASVGMQSNTSGGAIYDGLLIDGNTIHVLNAQAALPERVLGIWENGHAHVSDITVSNNTFVNDAAGNDPALNGQRAFRVSSHSGVATTVAYTGNNATGANIGYEWLSGQVFSGNQAVVVTGGDVTNCATGMLVQSSGTAHIETMEITGSGAGGGIHVLTGTLTGAGANVNAVSNSYVSGGTGDGIWIEATAGAIAPLLDNNLSGNTGFGLQNDAAPSILAERNWWGNNLAANVAAEVSGNADFDPWLASGTDINVAQGFQPFTYATTSGVLTTFVGTSGADTGALLAGDPITMQMNGETAFTAFAQLLNFDIQLDIGADLFTLGQTGIPTVFDGGGDNDTLVGTNVAQTWNVTGAGSGNIPGATSAFSNVESVRGGTAVDAFVFGAAGSLTGAVDGDLGVDSLDNSAIPAGTITPTGPGTLDGLMGTATGIGAGFDNINAILNEPADLQVTKTGPATATTNTQITYTITVTNAGPNPGISAQLTDTMPAGTTFQGLVAAAGWSCVTPPSGSPGTITCTALTVPLGPHVFMLTINGPAAPTVISNTATVTSANEGAAGNESATANTTFNGLADMQVTKTGPANATTNTPIAYTITVTNAGPDPAITLQLLDTIPAGTTFNSFTPAVGWTCSTPAPNGTGLVDCTRGSMPMGSDVFTLTVNAPAAPAAVSNTATVTSGNEGAAGNESATANTTVDGVADLSVTKTGPATAFTSSPVVYTITVTNGGPDPALTVQLTDVLPAGSTFNALTPAAGWSCTTPASGAPGTVTCTRASMPVGSDVFTLTINSPATPGPFSNTATVSSTNESAPGNESATANTGLGNVADLSITKTGPATAPSGGVLNYSITVGNAGPDAATNVVVTDVLPAGVTFSSATPSQGSCSGTTTVTCNLGTLANGASATIALSVTVTSIPGTVLVNTAAVDSDETDPTPLNATSSATVTVAAAAAAIPTASEWALMMMAMMLAVFAAVRLRQ